MKEKITAIILTKNEEENIVRSLQSLSWCDEILIIDDYSIDATVAKCHIFQKRVKKKKPNINLYKKHLEGDFATQRNFALTKASGDWVLFIDADEHLNQQLISEIQTSISTSDQTIRGFYIKRQDQLRGRWLKYGETGNIKFLRLARKNSGKWVGKVHETWAIIGKIEDLVNPLLHVPHPTISEFIKDINNYTDILARDWRSQGRTVSFIEILAVPLGKFLFNFIIKLGFLDKEAGFIQAGMMSFHSFLARAKLWHLTHPSPYEKMD